MEEEEGKAREGKPTRIAIKREEAYDSKDPTSDEDYKESQEQKEIPEYIKNVRNSNQSKATGYANGDIDEEWLQISHMQSRVKEWEVGMYQNELEQVRVQGFREDRQLNHLFTMLVLSNPICRTKAMPLGIFLKKLYAIRTQKSLRSIMLRQLEISLELLKRQITNWFSWSNCWSEKGFSK